MWNAVPSNHIDTRKFDKGKENALEEEERIPLDSNLDNELDAILFG